MDADERRSRYLDKVLTDELDGIGEGRGGGRNIALNSAAFALFGLVKGGELDEAATRSQLEATALAAGLDQAEVRDTINSAWRGAQPRTIPERSSGAMPPDTPANRPRTAPRASSVHAPTRPSCVHQKTETGRWDYIDTDGQVNRTVVRLDCIEPGCTGKRRKTYKQRYGTPDGRKPDGLPTILYRLPEVTEAVAVRAPVWWVEGEKSADALTNAGVVATTAPEGGGNVGRVDASPLAGATVHAVVDRDTTGDVWAAQVKTLCEQVGATVTFWQAATHEPKSDVVDHLAAGYGLDQLEPYTLPDEATHDDTGAPQASWAPIALDGFLDGTHRPPVPDLLPRTDGVCLLYRGLTNSLFGESESGKSLVAQAEAARILTVGGRVLVLDFESDPTSYVERLRLLGAPDAAMRDRLAYANPEVKPVTGVELDAYERLFTESFDLVVIDGVNASLQVFGLGSNSTDEVTDWDARVPKRLARQTGAAVLSIDHVTKNTETRGRFPGGSQAKLSTISGAAYLVDVTEQLGRGLKGSVRLKVAKDRPGQVRAHGVGFKSNDRTAEVARVVFDSTEPGRILSSVEPPAAQDEHQVRDTWKPTGYMEQVSRALEAATEGLTRNAVHGCVIGGTKYIDSALTHLVADGFARIENGPRNSKVHHSVRPYREADDHSPKPESADRSTTTAPLTAPPSKGEGSSGAVVSTAPSGAVGEQSGSSGAVTNSTSQEPASLPLDSPQSRHGQNNSATSGTTGAAAPIVKPCTVLDHAIHPRPDACWQCERNHKQAQRDAAQADLFSDDAA